MKNIYLTIFCLLFFSFKPLPKKYQGMTKKEVEAEFDSVKFRSSSFSKNNTSVIEEENERLRKEIERKRKISQFSPTFGTQYGTILTFERFYGVIDGNIISSGMPVNFKVDLLPHRKIPSGAYLSCTGENLVSKFNYRIIASCDRLITKDDEFEVVVGLKDLKKIEGIAPDFTYSGEEESVLGEGITAIMSGIIDAKKERQNTNIGSVENASAKNSLLNGLLMAADTANSKAREQSSKTHIVLAVNDKKNVIVEFKRRFSYEK